MNYTLPFRPERLATPIRYRDKILLIGSCFTEHISSRLASHKFRVLQNPHGILFNPLSVANSLRSYAMGLQYTSEDLFELNELWNSWDHHTRFSQIEKSIALAGMNDSQALASNFIKDADWIIITLGSAFQYSLTEEGKRKSSSLRTSAVANNHRAPAAWFQKRLLDIDEIKNDMAESLRIISHLNPHAKYLFTISPVRHVRDGVVENNRSKARLIEAVHALCEDRESCHYFPAYEMVIDILRDYRFYDIDLVHPNYAATEAVWEAFVQSCIAADAIPVMQSVKDIVVARSHLPRFPQTDAHRKFLRMYADKVSKLAAANPFLDLTDEAQYFNDGA